MQALLQILRGEEPVSATDWHAVLDLAQHEHVLPVVAHHLLVRGVPLPARAAERVQLARREAALAAFFWTEQLTGLLREFAAAGVEVIPLKGPSLAERVYGDATLRVCRDLDLLVRAGDYDRAESLLARIGFTPASMADDYHRQWHRGTAVIELHFNVENPLAIDFQVAGAWARSQAAFCNGQPCRLFAPEDELLFLCIHGVRHRFERLSLLLDIALALQRLPAANPAPRPEIASLGRLVSLGRAMALHLLPEMNLPPRPAPPPRLQQLADRSWHSLMEAPLPPLDWQTQHAFFIETELTAARRLWRRLAHLRIAATRLIEADVLFAARLGMRRRWQARVLRPFRLVFARNRR